MLRPFINIHSLLDLHKIKQYKTLENSSFLYKNIKYVKLLFAL